MRLSVTVAMTNKTGVFSAEQATGLKHMSHLGICSIVSTSGCFLRLAAFLIVNILEIMHLTKLLLVVCGQLGTQRGTSL